jgi:glycine cleavage system H lipoate-binding protein
VATATTVLEALGAFLAGLGGRAAVAFAAGLALALPALLLALAARALARARDRSVRGPAGVAFRRDAWFAPNHTWLARDRGGLRVGLDDLAQRLLPSSTAVDLPRPGMVVHRGDPIALVHAGGRVVRVAAPVDGTVTRVNRRALRAPGLVKREPYGAGWLFALAPATEAYRDLPHDAGAAPWLAAEERRLARLVEGELGHAAADGGELVAPWPALLGEDGWRKVVFAFLHAA